MYSTLVKAQEDSVPSGADLPSAGRAICEGLSHGADVQDIDDVIEKQGNSHEYALALVSPAAGIYCPQYSSKVAAWLAIQEAQVSSARQRFADAQSRSRTAIAGRSLPVLEAFYGESISMRSTPSRVYGVGSSYPGTANRKVCALCGTPLILNCTLHTAYPLTRP
jgi:hypothetical protein